MHEKSGKASLREINEELSSQEAAEKAVVELEEMGLVSVNAGVGLTERGLRRLRVFTGGMLRLRGSWEGFSPQERAHKAVHYIEHAPQVRRDLVEYLVIRGRAAKLTELSRGVEARILTILEPKPVFVARLYGVDLLPGRGI